MFHGLMNIPVLPSNTRNPDSTMHATCLECTVGSSKFIVFDGNTSIATSLPQHNRINSIKIIPSISVKNETSVPIHIYIKA